MRTRQLGRAALSVSPIGLGTANFGWPTPEPEAHAILDRALELGVTFIDTSDSYGPVKGEGVAERIIGRWLAADPSRRRRIVLATKVFSKMGEDPNARGLGAYHVRAACDASLARLETDHVDLYQMHHVDRRVTWEEVWETADQLRAQGKVLYHGSSNFAGWHLAAAQGVARARHGLGLVSEQSVYNLTTRHVELEVIPACEALGLGFLAYSPLAGGALAGPAAGEAGATRRTHAATVSHAKRHAARLARYEALCAEIGRSPSDVALAWVASRPSVTVTLIGPRTVAQLEAAVAAVERPLPGPVLERLEAIWPGLGGAAPEAYAW